MSKDEERLEMETGEKEETVYDDVGRQKLVEDGEISPEEAAFMDGAEGDGEQGKCAFCGKGLFRGSTHETKIEGKTYWFCSEEHAEKYRKRYLSGEEE